MIAVNSPTLQSMINSVAPGNGNMQFQTPFPSPKDMVMQAGMMNQPQFAYGQMAPQVTVIPESYVAVPGAPINPDLAHLSGQTVYNPINNPQPAPGRFMNNIQTSMYGTARSAYLNQQQNIVGGVNPYDRFQPMSYYQQQMGYPQPVYSYDPTDVYGTVQYYNGEAIWTE